MPRPVAVFDLDGTLVDTAPDLAASLNHCLAAAGLAPAAIERVRPHAGRGAAVMLNLAFEWAGRPLNPAGLAKQTALFLAHYEANIAVLSNLYDGALAALHRLAESGWRLAVCTNKSEHLARALLAELGIERRFAAICGADTFARRKPDPAHLLGTIARADGAADGSVMIGDTMTDVETAFAAGLPSILVDFTDAPDAAAARLANAVIQSYDQLDADLLSFLADDRRRAGRDPRHASWTAASAFPIAAE